MFVTAYSHQVMALSMMVEKESGNIESNDFENLWSKVRQGSCGVRYDSLGIFSYDLLLENAHHSLSIGIKM